MNRERITKTRTRARSLFRVFCCLLAVLLLSACGMTRDGQSEKVRDLEFTVVPSAEIPEELRQIIAQKQEQPFKVTFEDGENLYIAVGYGSQPEGGYSIAVKELYITENSIVIDTELLGPEKGETAAAAVPPPSIVVKTEKSDFPVIFQ